MFMEPGLHHKAMSDQPPVRTALYDEHLALDGNMVDFHGFEPVSYTHLTLPTSNGV